MRIVAGRFGGRRLQAPPGARTRPTSDRVREALFSMLGPLDGARVLDLFAGLGRARASRRSRAARRAPTFVERDARAAAVARANLEALGAAAGRGRGASGRRRAVPARTHASAAHAYDLVFLDPPYRPRAGAGAGALGGARPPSWRRRRAS